MLQNEVLHFVESFWIDLWRAIGHILDAFAVVERLVEYYGAVDLRGDFLSHLVTHPGDSGYWKYDTLGRHTLHRPGWLPPIPDVLSSARHEPSEVVYLLEQIVMLSFAIHQSPDPISDLSWQLDEYCAAAVVCNILCDLELLELSFRPRARAVSHSGVVGGVYTGRNQVLGNAENDVRLTSI